MGKRHLFFFAQNLLDIREVIKYTWPPLLAALGSIIVGLTDSLLIAHYSTQALAGVTLGAAIYELPINMLLGALMAYRIMAPRIHEEASKRREIIGLRIVLNRLLFLATLLACVILGGILCAYLKNDGTLSDAYLYLAARTPSLLLETASSAIAILLVVWGNTRIPLIVFFISAPFNLLFDLILIYGFGPFPELGALGAGIGSTISTVLSLLFLIIKLKKVRTEIYDRVEIEKKYQGWSRVAWPSVCSALVDYGGNVVFVLILSSSGVSALAGMRFGMQVHLLAFIFISSVSSAVLYILGGIYATNPQKIKKGIAEIRKMFVSIGVIIGMIIIISSYTISSLLSSDSDLRLSFHAAAWIVSISSPVMGLAYGNITVLRLFSLTGREFISNALGVWAGQIPTAFLLRFTNIEVLPFIGLFIYWMVRFIVSQNQVDKFLIR